MSWVPPPVRMDETPLHEHIDGWGSSQAWFELFGKIEPIEDEA